MDPTAGVSNSENNAFAESIARLSSRAGVVATILLSTISGAVIQTTGSLSSFSAFSVGKWSKSTTGSTNTPQELESSKSNEALEELATMALQVMKAAGSLVQNLDPEDETKLLRLRTKKHELVIVPDPKYTFIVVHETPPA